MPKERLSMRKIKEVLRLKAERLSDRQIAKSCAIARSTVADYLQRAKVAGLTWGVQIGHWLLTGFWIKFPGAIVRVFRS